MNSPRATVAGTSCTATRTGWSAVWAVSSARGRVPPMPSTSRRTEDAEENRVSPGERYARVFDVNLLRCISAATASRPARPARSPWRISSSSRRHGPKTSSTTRSACWSRLAAPHAARSRRGRRPRRRRRRRRFPRVRATSMACPPRRRASARAICPPSSSRAGWPRRRSRQREGPEGLAPGEEGRDA